MDLQAAGAANVEAEAVNVRLAAFVACVDLFSCGG